MPAPTLESTGKLLCDKCGSPNEVVSHILPHSRNELAYNDPALYQLYSVRCTRLRGLGALRNFGRSHPGLLGAGHTDDPIVISSAEKAK